MSKKPTYVWIVEDEDWEDVPLGVVGVYASKAKAVQHVRALRRKYCHAGDEDYEPVRLKDWDVTDEPDFFEMSQHVTEPHYLRAYRMEVRR
jgi:hypothetical protein